MSFEGLTPYLRYEDAGKMLEWLTGTFGFEERSRFVDGDGLVRQAEMMIGRSELWFSGDGPGYWEAQGCRPDQYVLVWVDDVDAMYQRVMDAGVDAEKPEDQTYDVRSFHVQDPEGYHWTFMRRLGTGYIQTKSLEDGGYQEVLPA